MIIVSPTLGARPTAAGVLLLPDRVFFCKYENCKPHCSLPFGPLEFLPESRCAFGHQADVAVASPSGIWGVLVRRQAFWAGAARVVEERRSVSHADRRRGSPSVVRRAKGVFSPAVKV